MSSLMLFAVAVKGFLISLMLCLDIGVVNTAIVNTGVRGGFRPALMLGLGSCFGDLCYAILSMVGMAVVLQIPAVRWIMWLGGGLVLLWFAFSMGRAAWRQSAALSRADGLNTFDGGSEVSLSLPREFGRGVAMALASPSSIIWFAAIGGAIIAQSTDGTPESKASFLSGFFIGAVAWSFFIATVAAVGRRWAGENLKVYCSAISALLFGYFAVDVFIKGYYLNISGN